MIVWLIAMMFFEIALTRKIKMKKILPLGLALASLASAPVFAAAGDDGLHLGFKTGMMDVDVGGFDIDMPLGFVLGFEQGLYGFEIEANFAGGDIEGFDLDFDTFAFYGVYRSAGEVYFKGKLGFLRENVDIDGIVSEDDSGLSLGLGVGTRVDNLSFEAEFTIIEEDVNYLSVGANVHF